MLSVFMWHIFSDYNPLLTTWISFPDPKSQLSYIYLFVTFNSALVFKYQLSVTSHVKYTFNCYFWYYILWAFNSQSVLGSKDLVFASKGFSTSWPKSHLISWLLFIHDSTLSWGNLSPTWHRCGFFYSIFENKHILEQLLSPLVVLNACVVCVFYRKKESPLTQVKHVRPPSKRS